MSFWATYWDVVTFYVVVIALLYLFRKKFEFQGIVALFKTQFGVKQMTNIGKRHPKFWDVVGLIGIIVGFIGMAFITAYLLWGLYALFFVPSAPPALSPVIPGVKIPGVPFTFPLWYTIAALFFAIIVHEAMHGILASAYKIPINSSGFAFLGPIPGAFVEPDEKTMQKRTRRQQLAILAGGAFANIVLAAVMFGFMVGFAAIGSTMVDSHGVTFTGVDAGSAVANAGVPANTTITMVNGIAVTDVATLQTTLKDAKPGDTVQITTNNTPYTVTLGASPDDASKAYLGIREVTTVTERKADIPAWLYGGVFILMMVAFWTYVISLGIGIANLLPIGPIDGGRMILLALESKFEKQKARGIWTRMSSVLLILVLILVIVPIVKALF